MIDTIDDEWSNLNFIAVVNAECMDDEIKDLECELSGMECDAMQWICLIECSVNVGMERGRKG